LESGTTAAAYVALIIGSILAFGGMAIQQVWAPWLAPFLLHHFPENAWLTAHAQKFPVNGQVMYFYAMLTASVSYVLVSLLGPRGVFDLDRMLHRGSYAAAQDVVNPAAENDKPPTFGRTLAHLIGLTPELSRWDRILFWATFAWSMSWWGIFLVGTFLNLVFKVSDTAWSWFWWFKIWLSFGLGLVCSIWLLLGGLRDAKRLFHDLRQIRRDDADDGTVGEKETAHYVPVKK
jgi:solute:Na+ symporter, SSS family